MKSHPLGLVAPLIVAVLVASVARGDDPPPFSPRPGVLLLRNGRILAGTVSLVGERYVVQLGNSGTVRLPAQEVDLVCRDLDEATQRLRERLPLEGVEPRLKLADWCLNQQRHGDAAELLLEVAQRSPKHPGIAHLERRLRAAIDASRPRDAAAAPDSVASPRVPTPQELEELVAEMPVDAVEYFTNTVQPMLLNRCGTNRCHDAGSEARYRLWRPTWERTLTRRYTLRNLHATRELVDPENAQNSALLKTPLRPHGGADEALMTEEDPHYHLLEQWTRRLTGPATEPEPVSQLSRPNAVLLQNQLAGSRAGRAPSPAGSPSRSPSDVEIVRPDEAGTRDPFDPELFNRRYFPD